MTIYQEAHAKIDRLPEETVYIFVQLMDKMTTARQMEQRKASNMNMFLETAGRIDIDEDAVNSLREVSLI